MKHRIIAAAIAVGALAAAAPLALHAAVQADAVVSASGAGGEDFPELRVAGVDQASVTRGRDVYRGQCASCHGPDQRGTKTGTDLSRSILLYDDANDTQLVAFLKGQHGTAKKSFASLGDQSINDVYNYLRASIRVIAGRNYVAPSILVGDPAAGKIYFDAHCSTCHSASGDFAGIGSKFDPSTLQGYIVQPPRTPPAARGGGGGGGGRGGAPAGDPNPPTVISAAQLRATVTPPGGAPVTGQLVKLTPFEVTIADLTSGQRTTWPIANGQPSVAITDPLAAHAQFRKTLSDNDMHNLTAYLAGLK